MMLMGAAALSSVDPQHSVVTSPQYIHSFASIIPTCDVEVGVSSLTKAVSSQTPKLLTGGHLTYLLYHSLASKASELFFGESENVSDDENSVNENSVNEKNGICFTILSNTLNEIGKKEGWSLCMSIWSICNGCVYDLLSNRTKRQMIDSGSIIFGRGMKSYRVCNENDIRSVIHVATRSRGYEWKEGVVCVGQIINKEGQFVRMNLDSYLDGSHFSSTSPSM